MKRYTSYGGGSYNYLAKGKGDRERKNSLKLMISGKVKSKGDVAIHHVVVVSKTITTNSGTTSKFWNTGVPPLKKVNST